MSLEPALYIISTPIGNLEDITLRALRVLREAHVIACEDTRHTRGLLTRYEISGKRLLSCHEHNEEARAEELVELMQAGENVALVSDAGTPAISDPGYRVVQAAIAAEPKPVGSAPAVPANGAAKSAGADKHVEAEAKDEAEVEDETEDEPGARPPRGRTHRAEGP